MPAKNRLLSRIVIMIVVAQLAGAVGSIATAGSLRTWYEGIAKPGFTPPSWVFATAWIVLYALMGTAAALVWDSKSKEKKNALMFYGVQLFLNVLWSFLFFGLRSPFYALLEIIVLWSAIAVTITAFYRISMNAALLMLPYIIWVTFAAVLNASVFLLNS